jgi:hypothetical protein
MSQLKKRANPKHLPAEHLRTRKKAPENTPAGKALDGSDGAVSRPAHGWAGTPRKKGNEVIHRLYLGGRLCYHNAQY